MDFKTKIKSTVTTGTAPFDIASTTSVTNLNVDLLDGKHASDFALASQVLTNVPAEAKFTDTVYTHPASHPASMITESSTKRFVSDSEKSTWNSKSDTDTVTTVNGNTGAIVKADITALGIPAQDTIYTHPNHSGDVTSVADGTQTISNNVVNNAKLAQVAVNIIKGRKTAGTGNVEDLTVSDVLAMLDVYTQTEADNLLADKAPLSSPEFTDIPKAPTAPTGTDTTQIASTEFVQQELDVHKAENANKAHGGFKGALIALNSSQSIPNNTDTKIAFNSIAYDTDSFWDNTNKRFVFTSDHKIRITANIGYDANSTGIRQLFMLKNGITTDGIIDIHAGNIGAATPKLNGVSGVISVTNGDYIEIYAKQNSGEAVTVQGFVYGTWVQLEVIE